MFSDLGSRNRDNSRDNHLGVNAEQVEARAREGKIYKIGMVWYGPDPSRDLCEQGLLEGLQGLGYVEGENLIVERIHANGDSSNFIPILQNMASSDVNAIVTFTTQALQTALVHAGEKPIVFTYITDPVAAGAGKSFTDHADNATGISSFPPIEFTVEAVKQIFPGITRIGTIYNGGEINSVRIIDALREECEKEGITLVENTVAHSSEVLQASEALVSKDVSCIYAPSDNSVGFALESLLKTANAAGIPVLLEDPGHVERGAYMAIGPGFYHSGKAAAKPLGRILNGADPSTIPFQNVSVSLVEYNQEVARNLDKQLSPEKLKTLQDSALPPANPSGKKWKLAEILYLETPPMEEALEGMKDAWKESRLTEGKDYVVELKSAQGDIAAMANIIDAALTNQTDIFVPLSTPALQNTIAKVKDRPVVFSVVASPMAAGAGESYTNHRPNVTGVSVLAPVNEMLNLLETYYPEVKKIGTLYCPAEANSVDLYESLAKACEQRGFTLIAVAANSSAEFADAAISLASQPIDAIVQLSDNLSSSGFTSITKAARNTRMPLFSMNSSTIPMGSPISLGRDYHEVGYQTVKIIERIIAGESPATIPFLLPPKVVISVSLEHAKALGMTIPKALSDSATHVVD